MLGNIKKPNEIVDASIFNFIKPGANDSLSSMSGIELQDLLYYVENCYLELRSHLGFDDKVTFGLELEFENAVRKRIETGRISLR